MATGGVLQEPLKEAGPLAQGEKKTSFAPTQLCFPWSFSHPQPAALRAGAARHCQPPPGHLMQEVPKASPARRHWHHHAADPHLCSVTPTSFTSCQEGSASPRLAPRPKLGTGTMSGGKKGPEGPLAPALLPASSSWYCTKGASPSTHGWWQGPWAQGGRERTVPAAGILQSVKAGPMAGGT